MKKIVAEVPQFSYNRLVKQKNSDGYGHKSWGDWVMSKAAPTMGVSEQEGIRQATGQNLRKMWGENIGFNLNYIRRPDMKSLRDLPEPVGDSVLVVGG